MWSQVVKIENDCSCCEQCRNCGAKRVLHYYCDTCGEEVSGDKKLIRFQKNSGLDDSWMCEECFNKVIDSMTFTIKVSTLLSSL